MPSYNNSTSASREDNCNEVDNKGYSTKRAHSTAKDISSVLLGLHNAVLIGQSIQAKDEIEGLN